jgi:hypothetical protein
LCTSVCCSLPSRSTAPPPAGTAARLPKLIADSANGSAAFRSRDPFSCARAPSQDSGKAQRTQIIQSD